MPIARDDIERVWRAVRRRLAAQLRRLRADSGETIAQVKKEARVSGSTISNLERERGDVQLSTLVRLAMLWNLEVYELLVDPEGDLREQIIARLRTSSRQQLERALEALGGPYPKRPREEPLRLADGLAPRKRGPRSARNERR